jgi:FlaG protein
MPPHAAHRPPADDLALRAGHEAYARASAAIPDSPPPEVLEAMAAAADAYDRLKTSGRQLHFETDPDTGRLTVQLLDPDGNVVTTLPPSKVLDLASGGTLD